jgi:Holliday junction DNA helicase RuvB
MQSCWRICRAEGSDKITGQHLDRACQLEGIDDLGLDYNEQQLLAMLEKGGVRLNVVATILGVPAKTVSACTESFLLRSGLITKDKYGLRHLTEEGRQHLSKSRPTDV